MLIAVRCKWLEPGTEKEVPVADCCACAATGANPCGYPLPLIQVMVRDRKPEVVQCSATMFGGCPREHGIKKHEDYSVDPDRVYTRSYGTLIHTGAEDVVRAGAFPTVRLEERFRRSITLPDGRVMEVTAALDVIHQNADGSFSIRDYKAVPSVSDSDITRRLPHHVPQFSIQRWIVEGLGFTVRDVELYFLSHKAKRNVVLYPEGSPEFSEARLWSIGKTEEYLRERGPALLSSLAGNLAPPLDDKAEMWRCRYTCDVADICRKLYGAPLPAD